MTVLYRRFLILTLMIAAFAGVTANLIQNTRSERAQIKVWKNTPITQMQCKTDQVCSVQMPNYISIG